MLRRSFPRSSFFSVLKEELAKIPALFRHDLKAGTDFLTGADETDRQKKVRAAHKDLEDLDRQKEKEAKANLTLKEKVNLFAQQLRHSVSTKSSVVALVQHCTRAHMAEVAVDLGIDVKNVSIVTEQAAVGTGEKVVGYIDAPAATQEQVQVYAQKLQQSCPAATLHADIEWRQVPGQGPSSAPPSEPEPKHPLHAEEEQPLPPSSKYQPGSSSFSSSRYGTPGTSSSGSSFGASSHHEDDTELTLPFSGMKGKKLDEKAPQEEFVARGFPGALKSTGVGAAHVSADSAPQSHSTPSAGAAAAAAAEPIPEATPERKTDEKSAAPEDVTAGFPNMKKKR